MLVIVCEQLLLNACLLEQGIPGELRAGVVVSRVQAILAEACLPEHLKDICQKQHICPAVQVAVVPQSLAPKGLPDLLRMGIVLVTDMRIRELALEGLLLGDFRLGEGIPGVHVLVRLVLCCDLESLRPVRRHQPVERCKQELGTVNET